MSKSKSKRGESEEPARRPIPWRILKTLGLVFGLTLLAGGAGLGIAVVRAALLRQVAHLDGPIVRGSDVRLSPNPGWLRADLARQVLEPLGWWDGALPMSDPELTRKLAEAFERSPWVSAARVCKGYGRVEVELIHRAPVACLPWGERCCYIDRDTVVLPADEVEPAALGRCLVLENLGRPEALPAVGQRFRDPRIAAAAALAHLLAPERDRLQLLVVIVESPVGQPPRCRLKTRRGARILWGDALAGTPTPADKLARLVEYQRRFGSLEHPDGPYEFDVTTASALAPVRLGSAAGAGPAR